MRFIKLLIALLGCGCLTWAGCGDGADGRVRTVAMPRPAPRGGEYVVGERLGRVLLPGVPRNLTLHEGALYAFLNRQGLATLDLATPPSPVLASVLDGRDAVGADRGRALFSGFVDDGRLVVSDRGSNALRLYSLERPLAPHLSAERPLPLGRPVSAIRLGDDYAVAAGEGGIWRMPAGSGTLRPPVRLLPGADFPKQVVALAPHWLLAADGYDGGLRVLDLRQPPEAPPVASFMTGSACDALELFPGFVAVANRSHGLMLVGLDDPARPRVVSYFYQWNRNAVQCLARWGEHGLLVGYNCGYLDVLDVQDPARPLWLARLPVGRPVNCLAVRGDLVYIGAARGLELLPFGPLPSLEVWRLTRKR